VRDQKVGDVLTVVDLQVHDGVMALGLLGRESRCVQRFADGKGAVDPVELAVVCAEVAHESDAATGWRGVGREQLLSGVGVPDEKQPRR
jgi:hypothetical protein